MFLPSHEIWKFAYAGDELNDWLPYAEDLIRKWSTQNSKEVRFDNTFQVILAAFLLKDDLLPASARAAFAEVMLETIDEVETNKLKILALHIRPPKPGRKESRSQTFYRFQDVKNLIQEGKSASEAYKAVAKKYLKSPDTIRREYERIKKRQKRKEPGEII